MDNIYLLKCWDYSYDFETTCTKEIDLDKYIFFEVELRCGVWFVKGHRLSDKDEYEWKAEDLSACGVLNSAELAKFIAYANSYPKSKGKYQSCKVSRFNNLHYSGDFYKRLEGLLKEVEKETKLIDVPEEEWFF